jgi:hypothetical protein
MAERGLLNFQAQQLLYHPAFGTEHGMVKKVDEENS